jgi:hypothetical protein
MPESFDAMLADLADAAAAVTPLPDVAAVRRRARERSVHRRMAVSAFALILLGTCGGTAAVVAGHLNGTTQGTITPGATANVSSAAVPPDGAAQGVGGTAPDTSGVEAYAPIAGTWMSVAGDEYLVVFPDGGIGMSEKGAWQLCDGQLADVGSEVFYVDEIACGDYGTSGLMLTGVGDGALLKLSVPGLGGSTPQTVVYRRLAAVSAASGTASAAQNLAGDWLSADARRRLVIGTGGAVTLLTAGSTGAEAAYLGTVTGVYGDGVRVEISCKTASAADGTRCGVVELERVDATRLYVVGSTGSELFTLEGPASGLIVQPTAGAASGTQSGTFSMAPSAFSFTGG